MGKSEFSGWALHPERYMHNVLYMIVHTYVHMCLCVILCTSRQCILGCILFFLISLTCPSLCPHLLLKSSSLSRLPSLLSSPPSPISPLPSCLLFCDADYMQAINVTAIAGDTGKDPYSCPVSVHACISEGVFECVYTYVCMYVCVRTRVCTCARVCAFVCVRPQPLCLGGCVWEELVCCG